MKVTVSSDVTWPIPVIGNLDRQRLKNKELGMTRMVKTEAIRSTNETSANKLPNGMNSQSKEFGGDSTQHMEIEDITPRLTESRRKSLRGAYASVTLKIEKRVEGTFNCPICKMGLCAARGCNRTTCRNITGHKGKFHFFCCHCYNSLTDEEICRPQGCPLMNSKNDRKEAQNYRNKQSAEKPIDLSCIQEEMATVVPATRKLVNRVGDHDDGFFRTSPITGKLRNVTMTHCVPKCQLSLGVPASDVDERQTVLDWVDVFSKRFPDRRISSGGDPKETLTKNNLFVASCNIQGIFKGHAVLVWPDIHGKLWIFDPMTCDNFNNGVSPLGRRQLGNSKLSVFASAWEKKF